MALAVSTNVGALYASAAASMINIEQDVAMQRLSTGKRINTSKDDPAGIAIASRLTAEYRGLDMAIRNSSDAQALINTAEGAYTEITSLLQRARELAVQGSNDTNGANDRTALRTEITQLLAEITNIGTNTSWAGNNLLNASQTFTFQIGSGTGTELTVTMSDATATGLTSTLTIATSTALDTHAEFQAFIGTVDGALATVGTSRAKLGAYSNRLDSVVRNLTNNSNAIKEGVGRIQDTDYAAETTNLSKTQILQQASTAMLAQANAAKQGVLALLQG
jgi:flagellin